MNYCVLKVAELHPFLLRDIRDSVIEKLKERIKNGYNPARPLTVVEDNGRYIVADGNHRLKVLQELGVSEVPCVIRAENPYWLATSCNQDEDTYAPMDLFDWLDVIRQLREQGHTQAQIGERVGWSRERVKDHVIVLDKIGAQVLDLAKAHQEGRAPTNGASAPTFPFSEGWFRSSGLYDLNEYYQVQFMDAFLFDKLRWNKEKVQRETAKYALWMTLEAVALAESVNATDAQILVDMIRAGVFKTETQLRQKLNDMNIKAKNRLVCGDAIQVLEGLDDGTIDIVITDPPYGIDYKSNRSKFSDHITKTGVANDGPEEALALLDETCRILVNKTKADAHLYFFAGWQTEPEFRQIIKQYFDIKAVLYWDKGNHGSGDLESWGIQTESIIYATKGNRGVNKRRGNVISVSRMSPVNMITPTQKPVEVIRQLLDVSAHKADTVCDPFMGSGATIKAVKDFGGLHYIGIELDKLVFEKAKAFIGDGEVNSLV
jgi:site-specific DNA-methyltransferase (adenine-specific)